MTESDEWATVETVVEDDMDSTFESRRGPSGIQQSIFEQSMSSSILVCRANLDLHLCLQLFPSSLVSIHGYFSLLHLVSTTLCRSFVLPRLPAQPSTQILVRRKPIFIEENQLELWFYQLRCR